MVAIPFSASTSVRSSIARVCYVVDGVTYLPSTRFDVLCWIFHMHQQAISANFFVRPLSTILPYAVTLLMFRWQCSGFAFWWPTIISSSMCFRYHILWLLRSYASINFSAFSVVTVVAGSVIFFGCCTKWRKNRNERIGSNKCECENKSSSSVN